MCYVIAFAGRGMACSSAYRLSYTCLCRRRWPDACLCGYRFLRHMIVWVWLVRNVSRFRWPGKCLCGYRWPTNVCGFRWQGTCLCGYRFLRHMIVWVSLVRNGSRYRWPGKCLCGYRWPNTCLWVSLARHMSLSIAGQAHRSVGNAF